MRLIILKFVQATKIVKSFTMEKANIFMALICICGSLFGQPISYPDNHKEGQVDDYHGTKVEDPYRWLEDENSTETQQWVEAQNGVTFNYLSNIPFRGDIRQRLEELWNYERMGVPFKEGPWVFFSKNSGLQNQSVLYVQEGYEGIPRQFIDPNTLSPDGTTSIADYSISHDFQYFAYTTSKGGSDWNDIYVMDIKSGKLLNDHIRWTKFSGIAWHKDGFYYSAYDVKDSTKALSQKNEFHKVYYHKIGTAQSTDKLIFENKEFPMRSYSAWVDEDEQFLFISESEGTSGNALYYKDLNSKKSEFIKLTEGFEFDYEIVGVAGGKIYLSTNDGAPRQQLVAIDPKAPTKDKWKTILAEKEFVMQSVAIFNNQLIAQYLEHASHRLYQFDLNGVQIREIELPGLGSVAGLSGELKSEVMLYSYSSFTVPSSIYKFNLNTGKNELFFRPTVKFDPDAFVTEQIFYESKDGTKIPMFLTYSKDLVRDGNNPVLLYGYGGFNISLTPGFRLTVLPFLENGGIYAVVNLRGGGEYGKEWHDAGIKEKKQNVFDDFIAAAEYLIANDFTNPDKIAIQGGSNGGLLVGACMTQRPDLFKVALPAVGVMDMLRFHKFTIGWAWTSDYGCADNAEEFQYLFKYSPLHNIQPQTKYPATLVTTADHDDRVVPAHSYKFIATLQENQAGENPVLIRIETNAGHGAGKPTSKSIDEAADVLAFMMFNFGLTYSR